jgi:hypothetical protein
MRYTDIWEAYGGSSHSPGEITNWAPRIGALLGELSAPEQQDADDGPLFGLEWFDVNRRRLSKRRRVVLIGRMPEIEPGQGEPARTVYEGI